MPIYDGFYGANQFLILDVYMRYLLFLLLTATLFGCGSEKGASCEVDGEIYEHGESWDVSCNSCNGPLANAEPGKRTNLGMNCSGVQTSGSRGFIQRNSLASCRAG